MEVQLYHHNVKYDSTEAAMGKTDGVAVIAFMFQLDRTIGGEEWAKGVKRIPQFDQVKSESLEKGGKGYDSPSIPSCLLSASSVHAFLLERALLRYSELLLVTSFSFLLE